MRNVATDSVWDKLNDALINKNAVDARFYADALLSPTNRYNLVDYTWSPAQLINNWSIEADRMAIYQGLADRLELINSYVDYNVD